MGSLTRGWSPSGFSEVSPPPESQVQPVDAEAALERLHEVLCERVIGRVWAYKAVQGLLRLHTAQQTLQGGAWSCGEAALPPVVSAKPEGVEWGQRWAGLQDVRDFIAGTPWPFLCPFSGGRKRTICCHGGEL